MKPATFVSVLLGSPTGVQAAVVPRGDVAIPELILPADPKSIPSGTVPVSVGFLHGLNWNFVVQNPSVALQVFSRLPDALAKASVNTCLNCGVSSESVYVENLFLYKTESTLGYDTTVAKVYYPEAKLESLVKMVSDEDSPLRALEDPVLRSLAAQIDSEFDILGTYK